MVPGDWPAGSDGLIHDGTVTGSSTSFIWNSTEIRLTGTTTWNQNNAQDRFRNGATFALEDTAHYTASHDLRIGYQGTGGNLDLSGGTITWGRRLEFVNGSVGNQSGGILDGNTPSIFKIDSTSVYNISGGEINLGSVATVIQISAGGYLNFQSGGTGGSLTASGYDLADMKDFVNTGLIRHDGLDGSGLGDTFFNAHFNYDAGTNTLTAVPEPQSVMFLAMVGIIYVIKRRK